jgi:hypothetical protein
MEQKENNMAALKHVGRVVKTKKKCAVAYRVLPGEPDNCLVVFTESLDAADHDSLINLIESNAGQTADEFADAMARSSLSDGRNMLAGFHKTGKLTKVATNLIEMTPNNNTSLPLDELNKTIAEQKGVTVNDLAMKDPQGATIAEVKDAPVADPAASYTAPATPEVVTDEALAAQYRSQADSLFKEAKTLREQAEELVPTKRKSKTTADG